MKLKGGELGCRRQGELTAEGSRPKDERQKRPILAAVLGAKSLQPEVANMPLPKQFCGAVGFEASAGTAIC